MTTKENLIGYTCLLAGEMNHAGRINYDGTVNGMDKVVEFACDIADKWLAQTDDDGTTYDEFAETALREKFPNGFDFDWSDFMEGNWETYCASVENTPKQDLIDDFVGSVRVGDLCFDLVLRQYASDELMLTYDLYVGGVDDGYGYSNRFGEKDYPYTEADGDSFGDTLICLSYKEFKRRAEETFTDFIRFTTYSETYDLISKASQPLHKW